MTILFKIEHTTDDGKHVLHFEKNHETPLSFGFTLQATGSITGSEKKSFVRDNYIYVNKNENVNILLFFNFAVSTSGKIALLKQSI